MTRLALLIDQERCIGCESCTMACKMENTPNGGPHIRVKTIGGGGRDVPAGHYPDLTMDFLPETCMHCAKPSCVDACPSDAIVKRPDGVVVLDQEQCTGCGSCVEACPYGAIRLDDARGVAAKCNLCSHRIDKGLEPFCVRCCEGQAMHFGDLDVPQSKIARLASKRKTFTLKPEAGTGPTVIYAAPLPKRKL